MVQILLHPEAFASWAQLALDRGTTTVVEHDSLVREFTAPAGKLMPSPAALCLLCSHTRTGG